MKLLKKIFLLKISIVFIHILPSITFADNKQQDQHYRLEIIGNTYKVGDVLSIKDADFIKKNAMTFNFNKSKIKILDFPIFNDPQTYKVNNSAWSSDKKIHGKLQGTIYLDAGIPNKFLKANIVSTLLRGKIDKMVVAVKHVVYGVVGSSGVGVIENETLTAICGRTVTVCRLNDSLRYSGLAVYYTTYVKTTFHYPAGVFAIEGKLHKK